MSRDHALIQHRAPRARHSRAILDYLTDNLAVAAATILADEKDDSMA